MRELADLIGLEDFAPKNRVASRGRFSHGGGVARNQGGNSHCPTSILMDSIQSFDEGGNVGGASSAAPSPFHAHIENTGGKTSKQKMLNAMDSAGRGMQDTMDLGIQAKYMYEQQKAMAAANKAAADKLTAEKTIGAENPSLPQQNVAGQNNGNNASSNVRPSGRSASVDNINLGPKFDANPGVVSSLQERTQFKEMEMKNMSDVEKSLQDHGRLEYAGDGARPEQTAALYKEKTPPDVRSDQMQNENYNNYKKKMNTPDNGQGIQLTDRSNNSTIQQVDGSNNNKSPYVAPNSINYNNESVYENDPEKFGSAFDHLNRNPIIN